jgi:catechol 2,3-dioxygenase-like lactoylglutathione lyase family enzyme
MNSKQAITQGAHHIGLTVPDLTKTRQFFENVLAFELLGEMPDYPAAFLTDGTTMITLWQAANPDTAVQFDRKNNIGLHHLALAIGSDAQLDELFQTLRNTAGVAIEIEPEFLGDGPTRHFFAAIPGGIRVEFIATAQQAA